MNPLFYVFISIMLVAGSQLLFKQGTLIIAGRTDTMASLPQRIVKMMFQKHIFIGILLNGVAAAFWLLALSQLELSFVFPFLSLNYILIPILASYFFKEKISTSRMVGIFIICSGIILIALS